MTAESWVNWTHFEAVMQARKQWLSEQGLWKRSCATEAAQPTLRWKETWEYEVWRVQRRR